MTPLTVVYLALGEREIVPSRRELAARCKAPVGDLPKDLEELVLRLSAVSSPAAVFAHGERSPEITSLLSLENEPSLLGERIALFAVTLGYGVDRLLEIEKRRSVGSAYLLDAVASAMAEAAADAVDRVVRKRCADCLFGRRFSPGYGALPLSASAPLLSLLAADKHLGIRQGESLLMHPTKTITAILGGKNEA